MPLPGYPVPPPPEEHKPAPGDGLGPMDEAMSRQINQIELLGEEHAARFTVPEHSQIGPALRFLHTSRNIHQMLTERTRAITIYLTAASLLLPASSLLMNARPAGTLMVPIEQLQYWCFPVTAGTLTVLAVLIGLWLIRIRVGLIYEVAKMNVLLGVASARVTRVNPFSISSLLQTLMSLAAGFFAGMFAFFLLGHFEQESSRFYWSLGIAVGVAVVLQTSYVLAIWTMTREFHLKK
jgi:hypothetical protein